MSLVAAGGAGARDHRGGRWSGAEHLGPELRQRRADADVAAGLPLDRGTRIFQRRGELTREALEKVWQLRWWNRGNAIEAHLAVTEYKAWGHIGATQGGTFPLIDFVDHASETFVSLKTTDARNVQEALGWLTDHIDDLARRGYRSEVGGVRNPKLVKLDVRVPPGKGGSLGPALSEYGAGFKPPVEVVVREFP